MISDIDVNLQQKAQRGMKEDSTILPFLKQQRKNRTERPKDIEETRDWKSGKRAKREGRGEGGVVGEEG